ncbi:MAG: hypothetical protein ABI664_22895 [bacterium]
MKDDELDEQLRDAALSYNPPPEPPREAMWEAISRARHAAAVVPIGPSRRLPRWIAAAAGIAAVLVAGIVIGRASRNPTLAPAAVATVPQTPTPTNRDDSLRATQALVEDIAPSSDANVAATNPGGRRAPANRPGSAPPRLLPRQRFGNPNDISSDAGAYRLAVVEHLTRTEVLLTSFRAQDQSGDAARVDAQFAALARELLSTTRLLLATRRGDDPNITRLLQDLEYVLMQLSQYANDGRRVDLDALNQSMDKRNVIPKLRSNIPAGLSASTGT